MREAKRCTNGSRVAGWRDAAQLVAVVLTVGLLTGLAPACNGDDNGGGTSTTPCLGFESSTAPGTFTITTVDGEPDDDECDFLILDLIVHDVQDLFAANFIMTFPASVMSFNSGSGLDSVLASGNTAVDVEARVTNSGELTVGITRVGTDTGVDVDAAGAKLIRLVFIRAGSSGSGAVDFTTRELFNSDAPPQEIPNKDQWSGGTIGILQL